ncbi:hydroxymethylglutaryl-CoA reductase [Chondrinema litorale]|uniref:hydroxymethylglutaryl-CoA reductase n=1 Tax=Chondrinema litorale TaxID=2994555 RepID=UPI00254367CA|nr:hydroxymethylglutaryl-CoA reductase [Chondrinema litorale]UZR92681.1 hydroxymethylglutaryl-CoA reductase [Chondrinema litorale]
MTIIPSLILKQLYTNGSLENTSSGYRFGLKNRLSDCKIIEIKAIIIDGTLINDEAVLVDLEEGGKLGINDITAANPIEFPLKRKMNVLVSGEPLEEGKYKIEIKFEVKPFGKLTLKVEDSITSGDEDIIRIPRDETDDYSDEAIKKRQGFVEAFTGVKMEHTASYSFDPHLTQGNIEHFSGVAQIPLGLAGPILINGEHAQGEFLIPMATSEGTLVASYNRGIKVMNLSGGATVTVVGDAMQRAPVFVFENARKCREFVAWVNDNMDEIRDHAEATSSIAKLLYIDPYLSNKFVYLRFNYSTGDAAGQNMVGRATFAACSWILDHYSDGITNFYLESNFATDKKASQINVMRTRGKRVIAECTVKRDVLIQHMRVEPEKLNYHSNIATLGAFFCGANNNGAHSPNAITAMFIATGQDVANVAESSAGIFYSELTPEGDLYLSLTIPSLIVATFGGGTALPTQQECLRILGCDGKNKVNKLAEIVAAVALAGEISLGSAISSSDWVSSHEKYGRNR